MSIHVYVRLAEPFWRSVGQRDLELELEEPAPSQGSEIVEGLPRGQPVVQELLDLLQARFPDLAREMAETPPIIFVGEQEVSYKTLLVDGDRVHLVWPVAGGSG